jgi:hypothetical protein
MVPGQFLIMVRGSMYNMTEEAIGTVGKYE